jgi:Phosphoesterase family
VKPGMEWTVARVAAVATSPLWAKTAIFITWDDWGGWADHVKPQRLSNWAGGGPKGYRGSQFRYGPRVPCLVLSPYAKQGINSKPLLARQHCQILSAAVRTAAVGRACAKTHRSVGRYVGELRFGRGAATRSSINSADIGMFCRPIGTVCVLPCRLKRRQDTDGTATQTTRTSSSTGANTVTHWFALQTKN